MRKAPSGTYKGLILVDFAGYPLNLEAFRKLADTYGIWIIEDACHAPGGFSRIPKGGDNIVETGIGPMFRYFHFIR